MKTFIVNVYKNKKWITLGLSILYLLLFLFPIYMPRFKNGELVGTLPFIIWIPHYMSQLLSPQVLQQGYISVQITVAVFFIYTVLLIACFILAIISVVSHFKGKQFKFTWSLVCATLVIFLQGLYFERGNNVDIDVDLCFTFYIFLLLLILDIVYLVLERKYLSPDYDQKLAERKERLADRKAVKQAKQDAALKQSPEYRIEQLEKELQELKAKNDDKDRQ